MNLIGVLFCKCGSHKVDVNHWSDKSTAVVKCYACGSTAELRGFTVGRVYVDDCTSTEAAQDRAVMRHAPTKEGSPA